MEAIERCPMASNVIRLFNSLPNLPRAEYPTTTLTKSNLVLYHNQIGCQNPSFLLRCRYVRYKSADLSPEHLVEHCLESLPSLY